MRASGFTDPSFARLAELAHLLAGLVFPLNRQPSAEAGMRRAMSALRISDPAQLLRAAEQPGPMRDAILAELTVGESYFFRDEAQLGILGSEIVPARIDTHGAHRPLRVWSAGCASGEEPHTIALLLRELRWPHPAQIVGTDIALPRLAAAKRGRYTRWALRGVSDERVRAWFRPVSSYFELAPSVRADVEFRALNLVHDDYGTGGPGYDLVLCRNVMIYFDLDTVARIAERLLASLDIDGWLVLGASDPPLAQLVACEAVMTPAGMAYRRPSASTPPLLRMDTEVATSIAPARPAWNDASWSAASRQISAGESTRPMAVPVRESAAMAPVVDTTLAPPAYADIHAAYQRADYTTAEGLAIAAMAAADLSTDTLPVAILHIRAVGNQGRLDDAGALCASALETHALSAELHYLHAMLLAESGWHAAAAVAARRSIYLDSRFVMSHLLVGDVLTRTGDLHGARRGFSNALELLAGADADAPVAGADGVPASRLHQIADLRLRGLASGTRT